MTRRTESLGSRIRRLREGQSLTQRALATLAGVSQATIAKLESGSRPSLMARSAQALAVALGTTVEELLSENQTGERHGA